MKGDTKINPYKSRSTIQTIDNIVQVVEPIPPEARAKELVSFSVTVDSVVATAILVFDDSHSRIVLHWGDGQIEVINLSKLRLASKINDNDLTPNTLTLQHIYNPPFDHDRIILIAATTDKDGRKTFDHAVFEIDPRYKLNFYSISLEFPEHLDSVFESESEVEVHLTGTQGDDFFLLKDWKADIETSPVEKSTGAILWRLEGSGFVREIAYSDDPISIDLELSENDYIVDNDYGAIDFIVNGIWDTFTAPFRGVHWFVHFVVLTYKGFDGSTINDQISMPLKIHPRNQSYLASNNGLVAEFNLWPDGKIYARFHLELTLIIPIDKGLKRVMSSI